MNQDEQIRWLMLRAAKYQQGMEVIDLIAEKVDKGIGASTDDIIELIMLAVIGMTDVEFDSINFGWVIHDDPILRDMFDHHRRRFALPKGKGDVQ